MSKQVVCVPEDSTDLSLQLGDLKVLKELREQSIETNPITHQHDSIVISFIGKQKTYKSTHANMIFGTKFPQGTIGLEQTTKGILAESSVLYHNNQSINIHCLDYEGFGSTGRNLHAEEEKAFDNKLMLLSYTMSSVIIFSIHASDISPFREFIQLMRMCVKNVKEQTGTQKPILVIFINTTYGVKNRIVKQTPQLQTKSQDEVREVVHDISCLGLVSQDDFKECKNYFSHVIVQTLYPNQDGEETEHFIIQNLKDLFNQIFFNNETNFALDSELLFDEQRWKETIQNINSDEQIQFQNLKNLKSKILIDYWNNCKGKYSHEFGSKLENEIAVLYSKSYSKLFKSQIELICDLLETDLKNQLTLTVSFKKLTNYLTKFIEKYAIELDFSSQEFQTFSNELYTKFDNVIQDYSEDVRNEFETKIENSFNPYLIEDLEKIKSKLLEFDKIDQNSVISWHQRMESKLKNRKNIIDKEKLEIVELQKHISTVKTSFLENIVRAGSVNELDIEVKKSRIFLQSINVQISSELMKDYEKFIQENYSQQLEVINTALFEKFELEFKQSCLKLDNMTELNKNHNMVLSKYPKIESANSKKSKERLEQLYTMFKHQCDSSEQCKAAMKFLQQAEYEKSKELFEKSANQSNIESQYQLGLLYLGGKITVNIEKAIYWLRQASDQGKSEAQFQLFKIYKEGVHGAAKNPELSNNFLEKITNIQVIIDNLDELDFEQLPTKFRLNKTITKCAVQRNGLFLKFASIELQDDLEIVTIAFQQNQKSLEFATERVKKEILPLPGTYIVCISDQWHLIFEVDVFGRVSGCHNGKPLKKGTFSNRKMEITLDSNAIVKGQLKDDGVELYIDSVKIGTGVNLAGVTGKLSKPSTGTEYFLVGEMYLKGVGVPIDTEKGILCHENGAKQGNIDSVMIVASYYEKKGEIQRGAEFVLRAASQDHVKALDWLIEKNMFKKKFLDSEQVCKKGGKFFLELKKRVNVGKLVLAYRGSRDGFGIKQYQSKVTDPNANHVTLITMEGGNLIVKPESGTGLLIYSNTGFTEWNSSTLNMFMPFSFNSTIVIRENCNTNQLSTSSIVVPGIISKNFKVEEIEVFHMSWSAMIKYLFFEK